MIKKGIVLGDSGDSTTQYFFGSLKEICIEQTVQCNDGLGFEHCSNDMHACELQA